jgi:hypothetical protein
MRILRWRTFLILLSACFGASVLAVVIHHLAAPAVPRVIGRLLELYASPGELLWWGTLGGAFEGYPSGLGGNTFWVLGNTALWGLATACCLAVGEAARSALRRLRGRR